MYVLEPLKQEELHKLFDDDAKNIIEYFIKKSVFSQPEKMVWQKDLPIQIPKEQMDYTSSLNRIKVSLKLCYWFIR